MLRNTPRQMANDGLLISPNHYYVLRTYALDRWCSQYKDYRLSCLAEHKHKTYSFQVRGAQGGT